MKVGRAAILGRFAPSYNCVTMHNDKKAVKCAREGRGGGARGGTSAATPSAALDAALQAALRLTPLRPHARIGEIL